MPEAKIEHWTFFFVGLLLALAGAGVLPLGRGEGYDKFMNNWRRPMIIIGLLLAAFELFGVWRLR